MYDILVVDDKAVFRRDIQRMPFFRLQSDTFRISYMAKNGAEALSLLKANKIDIVLTDIRMPLMDGIELLKEINREHLCKCTVLISEYSDFSYAKEALINGAFDYIIKPVDNEKLEIVFKRIIQYFDKLALDFEYTLTDNISIESTFEQYSSQMEHLLSSLENKNASGENISAHINLLSRKLYSEACKKAPSIPAYLPYTVLFTSIANELKIHKPIQILSIQLNMLKKYYDMLCFNSTSNIVNSVCSYLADNIEGICHIKSISEHFFINSRYLGTVFYKETGIHYTNFVKKLKLERAKILLLTTDLKIYQIAEHLGFQDTAYFSRQFKEYTGYKPTDFNVKELIEPFIS